MFLGKRRFFLKNDLQTIKNNLKKEGFIILQFVEPT